MKGSKIYQQNRAIGYVSDNVPATVRYLFGRKDNLITTCVGRSFQTFSSNHFRLLSVSGLHPEEITCLASNKLLTFSASGSTIYAWRAGSQIKFKYIGHNNNVQLMMTFGDHLLSVDEDSCLKIWEIKTEVLYLEIPFQNSQFKITAMLHPDTYVNKILLGSEQGTLQLWNIRQGKLIYSFKNQFGCKITVLEQSPALDVIGVGLASGRIILLNLKQDEIVMEFFQDWGLVTGLTFRTDGPTMMVSSSTNGQVAFWDLEEKKISGTLTAHADSVVTLKCLPSEPLLLTTSTDNSMKLWIFDKTDGGPRLLRMREGHSAPPISIRFHGSAGIHILSAGEDSSLRVFSTISESLNVSMGKASYNRKASKKKCKFNILP
jgi:U3 small nucleolar RNA-associated protein 21